MPTVDTIRTALFEDPIWIYVVLALLEAAALTAWRARPGALTSGALVVPVALAAVVFLVSAKVVTDREQIINASQAIAEDVQGHSADVLAGYLDDEYRGFAGPKLQAVARCRSEIARFMPRVVSCRRLEVELTGREARLQATTVIVPDRSVGGHGGPFVLKWDIRWIKRSEGWRIIWASTPRR